jgi:hypothetical protein
MSHSIKTKVCCLSLFATLLFSCTFGYSQVNIPAKQETILTFAHDFLQVFYPELFDKEHRITLAVTTPGNDAWLELGGVFFTVTSANVSPVNKLISPDPETTDHVILGGSFWLPPIEYGRVRELHAYSDAVHQRQREQLHDLVASHPEWSNTQIANALKQAGARFGPDDKEAFVKSLPLNKAERFLGKIKITSVEFDYPRRDQNGRFTLINLSWIVQAEAELPDGTHPTYTIVFEPFEGKLTDLGQSLDR